MRTAKGNWHFQGKYLMVISASSVEDSGSGCVRAGTWKRFSFAVQTHQVYAPRLSSRLAGLRYKGGDTSYLDVLDAECRLFSVHLNYMQTQGNMFRSMVSLYGAMRGARVTDAEGTTAAMCGANGGPGTPNAGTPASGKGTVP
nr:TolC family protein [Paraburkholderia sp. BL8N3]